MADEVVKAFYGYTAEIEVSGHPSSLRRCFKNIRLVSIQQGLVCGCQSHNTRTDYDDPRHGLSFSA